MSKRIRDRKRRGDELFEVVQHQEHLALTQHIEQVCKRTAVAGITEPAGRRNGGW